MRKAARLLCVALLLSSAGCLGTLFSGRKGDSVAAVQTGPAPDWVHGPSSRYPREQYLTAVGSGESRGSAEEDARGELARIFRADIDSRVSAYEKYFQVRGGGKAEVTDEVSLANLTTVSAKMVIEGSEIAEVFRQKKTGQYFTLAILDRAKAARILRDRILRLDDEIAALRHRADGAEDKLAKLRYLKRTIPKFVFRDASDSELRIVDLRGGGVPGQGCADEVKSQIDQLLAKDVAIGVSVDGAGADELRTSVLKELSRLGLPVAPGTPDGTFDLRLDIHSTFEVTKRTQDFFDTRWAIRSRLLDRSGKELKTVQREIKGGYVDLAQAERLVLAEVKEKIPVALAQQVDDYLLGR